MPQRDLHYSDMAWGVDTPFPVSPPKQDIYVLGRDEDTFFRVWIAITSPSSSVVIFSMHMHVLLCCLTNR